MANAIYVKAAEKLLGPLIGAAGLPAGTLKAALVANTYAQALSTDEFYSSISAHVIDTPMALVGATVTGGKLDADDLVLEAVAGGSTVEAVVLFIDTGNPATSPLIAYLDQMTGLPYATTGGNVTPRWDNGSGKIFTLV
jgi:hypothetical protein